MEQKEVKLTKEAVRAIEQIINGRCKAEIACKNGKICVWEVRSKTKHEEPVA